MRDDACPDCRRMTAGDCGKHGPWEKHDCVNWNSNGACYICRRPLSIEEQTRDEAGMSRQGGPAMSLQELRREEAAERDAREIADPRSGLVAQLRAFVEKWRTFEPDEFRNYDCADDLEDFIKTLTT